MANWRYNPRTGTYNAVSITDEIHTIGFDTEANAYGIRLDEAPQRSSPSTVTITETASGGSTFTEISSRTAPSAGQFWVDYDADTFTGTGFIEFNASDSGTEVSVDYQGLGSVVKDEVVPKLSANNTFAGDNTFTGDNTFNGSTAFAGITASSISGTFTGDLTYWSDSSPNVAGSKTLPSTGTWMVFILASLPATTNVDIDGFTLLNNQTSATVNCSSFRVITGSSFTIAKGGFAVISQIYAIRLSPNT